MRKLILIGMAFAMIAGFGLGCEQPEGPDNGNYQDQQGTSDPYQQQESAPQPPGYDN